jgi:DNA-binding TFAR19-related protein (PDSD5 family)
VRAFCGASLCGGRGLGQETDVHASHQQDEAEEIEKIRTQRTVALKRLEAQSAAMEAAEAAATAEEEKPQRSEIWTSRRSSAALLTASARRTLVHAQFARPGGVWETERTCCRAAATLVAAVRRSKRQWLYQHQLTAGTHSQTSEYSDGIE